MQDKTSPKLAIYHILIEGGVNGSNRVNRDDVDAWTTMYHQNYPVLMGDGKIQQTIWRGYGSTIGLPFALVIDRETMVVKGQLSGPGYQAASDLCDQ